MSKKRKSYSASFKSKIALAAIREENSLSELSSRYGVNANMISRWKKEALRGFEDIFSSKREVEDSRNSHQVKELHAKIGELTVERDFLSEASRRLTSSGGKVW